MNLRRTIARIKELARDMKYFNEPYKRLEEYTIEELYDYADDLAGDYWYDEYQELMRRVKRVYEFTTRRT